MASCLRLDYSMMPLFIISLLASWESEKLVRQFLELTKLFVGKEINHSSHLQDIFRTKLDEEWLWIKYSSCWYLPQRVRRCCQQDEAILADLNTWVSSASHESKSYQIQMKYLYHPALFRWKLKSAVLNSLIYFGMFWAYGEIPHLAPGQGRS